MSKQDASLYPRPTNTVVQSATPIISKRNIHVGDTVPCGRCNGRGYEYSADCRAHLCALCEGTAITEVLK